MGGEIGLTASKCRKEIARFLGQTALTGVEVYGPGYNVYAMWHAMVDASPSLSVHFMWLPAFY